MSTELGATCRRQEILLSKKDDEIRELKQKLVKQKESYKREVAELHVQMQQEAYMAQMTSKGQASSTGRTQRQSKPR